MPADDSGSERPVSGFRRDHGDGVSEPTRPRAVPSRFGELLLGYRRAVGLTQEDLATRAGMSARALRNLERGRSGAAQRHSAEVLADALGLVGEQRADFLIAAAAARRRAAIPAQVSGAAPSPRALCALPGAVSDFVGRREELGQLRSWAHVAGEAAGGSVVSIVGPAGIGKTALAVTAAWQLTEEFPDGCLALDLRGMDDSVLPADRALDRMLRSLGLNASQIPHSVVEQSNLFRSMLAGRRVLLLLDNANDEAQIRPLLATSRGCLTIITCRRTLSGLEGARWLWLDPLATPHAVELVASITNSDRVRAEPEAAAELVELCGNLPLAVRIAGNRLARQPRWSVADLVGQLRDERARLTTLSVGSLQVRAAFEVSYQRLSATGQHMFRRLALIPGADFGTELVSVAVGTDATDTDKHIDELVDATLLQPAATPRRYQFHDLIRVFARERLESCEPVANRDDAASMVYEHLLDTATAAGRRLLDLDTNDGPETNATFGTRAEAIDWLERESSNWLAAERYASAAGWHHHEIALVRAMHWFSDVYLEYPWPAIFERGVAAAQAIGDRHAEATLLNFLGWAQNVYLYDVDTAVLTHQRALTIALEIGDRREHAWALAYLGSRLAELSRLPEALAYTEQSLALFTALDNWSALNSLTASRGRILRLLGRYDEAQRAFRAVLDDLAGRTNQVESSILQTHRAMILFHVGEVMLDRQEWSEAAATFHEARELITTENNRSLAGQYAFYEGTARARGGETTLAMACLQRALTIFTDVTTRWWQARTLTELAAILQTSGATNKARNYRQEALALCEELGTDQARTLAAELTAGEGPTPPQSSSR